MYPKIDTILMERDSSTLKVHFTLDQALSFEDGKGDYTLMVDIPRSDQRTQVQIGAKFIDREPPLSFIWDLEQELANQYGDAGSVTVRGNTVSVVYPATVLDALPQEVLMKGSSTGDDREISVTIL